MANGFKLTLDTIKPTGSISRGTNQYVNSNFNLTITNTGNDGQYMKIWFDTSSAPTEIPSGLSWIDISSQSSTFTRTTEFLSTTAEGKYYYHVVFLDQVNNQSDIFSTEQIVYDTTAPALSNVWIKDIDSGSTSITNGLNNYFGYSFGDAGYAPVTSILISCPDFSSSVTMTNPTSPYDSSAVDPKKYVTFSSSAADGQKTITFTLTDACGNTSTATWDITLDRTIGDLTLTLYKADGTTSLPAKINYSSIKAGLVSTEEVVAYKLWEGDTEPSTWTSVTEGVLNIVVAFSLSSGDATKVVKAKVKDAAGSETETPVTKSVLVDYTAPVVSMTASQTWIAGTTGSDTGTVTASVLTLTHDEDISGLASWDLTCNGTSIKGSLASIPSTFNLTASNGLVEGENTIVFTDTDQAGNTNTATVEVYLDKTKPTASIGTLQSWYNNWDTFTVSVSAADSGSGVSQIYVWTDTSVTSTTVPSGATALSLSDISSPVPSSKISGTPQQSASNYIHVHVVDNVGHFADATAVKFGYDNVAPTQCSAAFSATSYSTVTASIVLTSTVDATSGVTMMKVAGDISKAGGVNPGVWFTITPATAENPQQISVTLSANSATETVETKTVTIYLKDAAGNESGVLSTISTELDQTAPGAILTLRDATDDHDQPSVVSVAQFSARISGFDDATSGKKAVKYKLYGDFNYDAQSSEGITEDAASWNDLTYESGQTYMLIQNMFCTSNPTGTESQDKAINLKVMDDAGNVSNPATSTFTYDTGKPVVSITTNPDYYIVSKLHTLRRNASGEISGKYADLTKFTFTPSETIQAYKVCAYQTLDEAKYKDSGKTTPRDPSEETPIQMNHGSEHTYATGLSSAIAVDCTIAGEDYEDALVARGATAGSTAEGLHIVVIYVQDLAGTWSEVANFTV